MGELPSAIIGAAAGIIAAIITGVVSILVQNNRLSKIIRHLGFGDDEASMKRQLEGKFGNNSKSISEQLGVTDKSITSQLGIDGKSISAQLGVEDKSISAQLGVESKSISSQLGVGNDDKSLTKQHNEMKQSIITKLDIQSADINSIMQKLHDEEVRRSFLDMGQQEILQNVNAMIAQWERSQSRINQLESELAVRNAKTLLLENENMMLKQQINPESSPGSDGQSRNYKNNGASW